MIQPLSKRVFALGAQGELKRDQAPLPLIQGALRLEAMPAEEHESLSRSLSRPAVESALSVSEAERLVEHSVSPRPLLIGVDEAGRGPWAGPVVAAAVIFPAGFGGALPLPEALTRLNDSKQLSEARRLELIRPICQAALAVGVGVADAEIIDETSITRANYMAMYLAVVRALRALAKSPQGDLLREQGSRALALIDGKYPVPPLTLSQIAMIKGDQRSYHIAAASVVAKVTRDKMMIAAHRRYPVYGFDRHKGYGTKAHQGALKAYGPCPLHRRSFKPISALLS